MTLEEIKQAIEDGHTVCWKSDAYEVSKTMTYAPDCKCTLLGGSIYEHCDCNDSSCTLHHDSLMDIKRRQEQTEMGWKIAKLEEPRPVYSIVCNINAKYGKSSIGLTHIDRVTMNGDEEDFFIKEEQ